MYIHGTIKGRWGKYRLNTKTNRVEFELWEANQEGHNKPYWHEMGSGWDDGFVAGYPTEKTNSR